MGHGDRISLISVESGGAVAMNFQFRRAGPGDAAALSNLAFRSKASNGYDTAFMEACRAELTFTANTMEAGETWLVETGGELAGFIDVRLQDGAAEVFAMFVEPGLKRNGLGRALWQQLETAARNLGADTVMLDADPAAVPFYEAMGCTVVGESPSGSIPGRMLPRLRKTLRGRLRRARLPSQCSLHDRGDSDRRLRPATDRGAVGLGR
jgi:ribosomal protein S18 acetylase RimI-like enzyme